MSVSKRKRFNVFKRDGFTCQYCGAKPPKVVLECDHIIPVSKGGKDEHHNLITSCFSCNRGKSNILLTDLPETFLNKAEELKEKRDQLKAYNQLVISYEKEIKKQIDQVDQAYQDCNEGYVLTDSFRNGTVRKFIDALGVRYVVDNMYTACYKVRHEQYAIKYFCGICWNQIRELGK